MVAETALPREVPKPVEEKRKPSVEEATTETLPKRAAAAAAMGQWAGGPPNDKRRVELDEGPLRVGRLERREDEKGGEEESIIPVARSTDTEGEVAQQSGEKEKRGVPVFEDMEEPTVEVVVWTTSREDD